MPQDIFCNFFIMIFIEPSVRFGLIFELHTFHALTSRNNED